MSMMLKEQNSCFWHCRNCVWDDIRKWPVCKLNGQELHRDEKIPEWCPEGNGMQTTYGIVMKNVTRRRYTNETD